jgi:RNA polymerase-binding transcription factor DksA
MDAGEARHHLEDERRRLERLRATFDGERLDEESRDEALAELSHLDQHLADSASETFEREKDLSILERIEEELDDVARALRRLDQGTYGTCEACGRPIPDERLEALPAARYCVQHQDLAERLGRDRG